MPDDTMPRAPGAIQAPPAPEVPGADVDERSEDEQPTAALVREAIRETRELARLETALATEDLKSELLRAKNAGIALGASAALAISGFTMLCVALALAFKVAWLVALVVGGVLLLVGGVAALGGWRALPRDPLGRTKERIGSDLKGLRERLA
jgi:hypothetical protein